MKARTITAALAALALVGVGVGVVGSAALHGSDRPATHHQATPLAATGPSVPRTTSYAVGNGNHIYAYWHQGAHDVPWIVLVHGGSWKYGSGDDTEMRSWASREQARGYDAFTVDYRLMPKVHWPVPLDDVQHAVLWIRAHAAHWGLDPQRSFMVGDSAGGQLASITALRLGGFTGVIDFAGVVDPYYEYLHGTDGHLRHDAYLLNDSRTPAQDPTIWQDSRAEHYLGRHTMPFLILHAVRDPIVQVQMSRNFYAALVAAHYPATLDVLDSDVHPATTPQGLADADRWMDLLAHAKSAPKVLANK